MFRELLSHIVVFDSWHIYLDILIDQRFSRSEMIIEFASEVSNLAWRVSQSQNGGAIFTLTKGSPMFGSVVFDYQWCILIVMSVKSSFYNEYDIKNNEKHVLWAQRSFQNHHQTFHNRCPEKIGPLPKKIGPLFHADMSGKYGTGPNLLNSSNKTVKWFDISFVRLEATWSLINNKKDIMLLRFFHTMCNARWCDEIFARVRTSWSLHRKWSCALSLAFNSLTLITLVANPRNLRTPTGVVTNSWVQPPILTISSNLAIVAKLGDPKCLISLNGQCHLEHARDPLKMWTKYCCEIYVPHNDTAALDDILDECSKFQNRMFISFPQFLHCSRDEVYFPKLSCLK